VVNAGTESASREWPDTLILPGSKSRARAQ
jgi:hypothetical protein